MEGATFANQPQGQCCFPASALAVSGMRPFARTLRQLF